MHGGDFEHRAFLIGPLQQAQNKLFSHLRLQREDLFLPLTGWNAYGF